MSGISSNVSVDFEQQLALLNQSLESTQAEVDKLKAQNPNVVNAYNNAKQKLEQTLAWVKTFGNTDMQGNPLKFNTLQEFHDLCLKGGIKDASGKPHNNGNGFQYSSPPVDQILKDFKAAEAAYLKVMGPALDKLNEAKTKLDVIGTGLKESIAALQAMAKLLQSGDIEGAVMMLQTNRAKVLEQQLGARIEGMQARNAQIKNLNDQLKVKQGELGGVTGSAEEKQSKRDTINAAITGLKGDMDKLNSDSQLDMIGIQGLVNKRNEAFDMLTNLLGKFQKTIDGIVGNLR